MNDEFLEAYIRCQKDRSELIVENERLKTKTKDKELLKEIYEKLNEIQYALKYSVAKKKIRRKVKEVMTLVEKVSDKE